MDIHQHVIQDERRGVTVVEASAQLSSEGFVATGVGSAKCHPTDRFVPETGEAIASARALRALADELEEAVEPVKVAIYPCSRKGGKTLRELYAVGLEVQHG